MSAASFAKKMRKRKALEKWAGFGEDVTREGIELAKKLKANGLHNKLRGNAMKDYMHHMDMSAHPKFMQGVKLKAASAGEAALEAAGLGILARPSIKALKNPKTKNEDRSEAKHEVAGLGVLAVHPAYELGKAAIGHFKKAGVGRAMLKIAGDFDKANYMKDMARKPAAVAKPHFTMDHLNSARQKMGLHAVAPRPMTPRTGSMAAKAVSTVGHAKPGLLGKALSIFK